MRKAPNHLANFGKQFPLFLGLIMLWMLLWGEFSWSAFFGGALLSAFVVLVFYLPRVELSDRINPWRTLSLALRFIYDVFMSSLVVAAVALRFDKQPANAIIKIPLITRDDIVLTWTALAISLVPGSIVVEADRSNAVLYLHSLAISDEAALERARRDALQLERRIIHAFGPKADLEKLRRIEKLEKTRRLTAKGVKR